MDDKTFRPIPEERLKELLGILLPYGYSHYEGTKYTGVSPYINDGQNIITIVANDEGWESPFSICMDRFDENYDETDSLGFYKGIMKLIAPELKSDDEKFEGTGNVLDFDWVERAEENTPFPVSVTLNVRPRREQIGVHAYPCRADNGIKTDAEDVSEEDGIPSDEEFLAMEEKEKEEIKRALELHDYKLGRAAEALGVSERTLRRRIAEYGITIDH